MSLPFIQNIRYKLYYVQNIEVCCFLFARKNEGTWKNPPAVKILIENLRHGNANIKFIYRLIQKE